MKEIVEILNKEYPVSFDHIELMRDMGSTSYIAFSSGNKYFLRAIKPAFFNTAISGANVQMFLQMKGFPVPSIIFTNKELPYVKKENALFILYEYIEGDNCDPEQDVEVIGALVGSLHKEMKSYSGELIKRDKHFYIGRYIDILYKKQYPKTDEYLIYGNELWEKIKHLPRGYCHGDLYDGNIRKTPDGKFYIHDFDTSCDGFPMYDVTLICNMTKYFDYDMRNYGRSQKVISRFIMEYIKYYTLSQEEVDAFYDLIAIQHFSTQATIIEIFGMDCIDGKDIDNQLEWLYKWREQCKGN